MKNPEKTIVASLIWEKKPCELHLTQADAIQHLGFKHKFFTFDGSIPPDTKIIIVQGPYGTLLPLVRQLDHYQPDQRPILAYWFVQSLDMQMVEWLRKPMAKIFSDLNRSYGEAGLLGNLLDCVMSDYLCIKAHRLRFLGDILWLHRHNLLDVLALSSTEYSKYLSQYGIESIIVPRGYHPSYGQELGLKRDIDVVWMGKMRTKRRREAVHWLRERLEEQGHVMRVFDGEETPFIFGEKRTRILNRARFVLNVFPYPTDELSIRYYIAAANGAVVLTEPGKNEYEFVPGKHLVECPLEEMPGTINYYLEHEKEWQAISDDMLSLVQNESTLQQSVARILDKTERVIENRL